MLGPYYCISNMDLLFVGFVVTLVAVVAVEMHWGMLCEVCRDCTGSYILSQ